MFLQNGKTYSGKCHGITADSTFLIRPLMIQMPQVYSTNGTFLSTVTVLLEGTVCFHRLCQ